MTSTRKIGVLVGVMFILATVAGGLNVISFGDNLTAPDYLVKISEHTNSIQLGIGFYLIMAIAVAAIAVIMYPILKQQNDAAAMGYVGARLFEGGLFVLHVLALLTLIALSDQFVKAGMPDSSWYQSIGALLLEAGDWAYTLGFGLFFTISALVLNTVLFLSKIVPRWLSGWGFVGAVLIAVHYAVKFLAGNEIDVLFFPIAFQEMIFALWLIVKGFNLPSGESIN